MKLTIFRPLRSLVFLLLLLSTSLNGNRSGAAPANLSPGVSLDLSALSAVHTQLTNLLASAPRLRPGSGVAGLAGGVHLKILAEGPHEILLPMPQETEAQTPLCYAITATPLEAVKGYRLRQREGSNQVLSVQVQGTEDQQVQLHWSALVLFCEPVHATNRAPAEPYRRATPCVQSADPQLKALADRLFPADANPAGYAAAIQQFIRTMKQQNPPRSLDALGILKSGANWICTANANLAAALLRAKDVPCQSVAVVPLTGQRLEMHRIIDYYAKGRWHSFDPSSLQGEIPLRPCQNLVMSQTTIADEETSMQPRLGCAFGCPYGQELELLDAGVTLWGNDFFWTQGRPLAAFEPSEAALRIARAEWSKFLETGKLSPPQLQTARATNESSFRQALGTK